ncbi:MAG: hypothetical protein LBB91_00915 [Clostridiales bacterium]|jgi:hypothetical protein|nr:hypothetical protein [Clostridiales bacterium]
MQEGPFTQMFDAKEYVLKPVYFEIEVLEKYFKNPKYLVFYSDYRGSVLLMNGYEEIRDFGLAYYKKDTTMRAIVTFAEDLKKMPIKTQGYWFSYLLDEQDECFPNEGFVKNLILGDWVEDISIYQALLMEIHYINKMCKAVSIEPMFREEFPYDDLSQNNRPIGYHNILLPTRENYYNFINTLEKMTTSNINIKTFQRSTPMIKGVDNTYTDKSGNTHTQIKNSVSLLDDWLNANISNNPNIHSDIIIPLKKLVKLRQTPAHRLYENEYDKRIWNNQNELMHEIYTAIRNIRLAIALHPFAKQVHVDETLFEGKRIVIY